MERPQPSFEELQRDNLDRLYHRAENPYAATEYRMPDQFRGRLEHDFYDLPTLKGGQLEPDYSALQQ